MFLPFAVGVTPLFAARERKQDGVADADAEQEHQEAVDAEAHAAGGRHAELQCAEEVLVDVHGLGVAGGGEAGLLLEPFTLDDRVVELEYATASSTPLTTTSQASTSPAVVRCRLANGRTDSG